MLRKEEHPSGITGTDSTRGFAQTQVIGGLLIQNRPSSEHKGGGLH
jgi:hypothetical protein